MFENRKSPRQKMVLPVKVSIEKDTHLAHTLDISGTGARLGALRTEVQPGTVVTLQRGTKKAKFRITWVRQLAPTEVQAGIEAVEEQDNFWGIKVPDRQQNKSDVQAFLSFLSDSSKVPPTSNSGSSSQSKTRTHLTNTSAE